MPVFLVERYLRASAIADLPTSVTNVARLCAEQGGRTAVRYLQSMYLPAEDICFCLFRASSSDDVRAVNDSGHFPLDRVTEAVLMISAEHHALTPPRRIVRQGRAEPRATPKGENP